MRFIGINGFGRVGRQVFKAIRERYPELEIVAINDLGDVKTNAHLLRHDSTYGRYEAEVGFDKDSITVNGKTTRVFAEKDPARVPWGEVGAEIVIESTPIFTDAKVASRHIHGGARKVIITAPAKNEDVTIVMGVNEKSYDPSKHHVISNASCTTNGLAPVAKVLLDDFGIIKGQMSTIHAFTNSQKLLDQQPGDLRDIRGAAQNIVPTATGAARALKLVIPEVEGRLDGMAYRVPTVTVSIVEIVCLLERSTSKDEVNEALEQASSNGMEGILDITYEPLVSMDFRGDTHSSIVDGLVTNVVQGDLAKVAAWYDNEWGYCCRVADLANLVASRGRRL